MVGFYSGSGRGTENAAKSDSKSSEALSQEARSSDKDECCTDVSEQDPSEIPNLETRVAVVSITDDGGKDAHIGNKENLEQISADNVGVTKCDPMNGSTERLKWNGDTVYGDNLEWEGDNDTDDDDSGWITPENFRQACEEMGGVLEEKAAGIAVGCTTTDFAMQVCL